MYLCNLLIDYYASRFYLLYFDTATFLSGYLYLLRERERLGNLAILLWRTLLHQRFEHLAQRGPDGGEISFAQPVCVLRGQPGEVSGSEWGGLV